jgi:RIP metalloprotease RseP
VADLIGREATTPTEAPRDEQSGPADASQEGTSWKGLAGLVAFFAAIGVLFGLNVVLVILAVVVSIFLHELGHYMAARWSGMKATEFFIGFGPRIWSFRRGETEFGVKPLWAGAYVKIIGMNNLDEVAAVDEPRTFRRQSYPRRLVTAFAGPGMNLVLGFVLLLGVAVFAGYPAEPDWPRVDPVEGGGAQLAGLEPGDRLISVAGTPVPEEFADFRGLVQSRSGETVEVVYERDGEVRTTQVDMGNQILGMSGTEWPTVHVQLDSAAAAGAHLESGDVIVEIDGSPVTDDFEQFVDMLAAADGTRVPLVVERDGEQYATALDVPPGTERSGLFGVSMYRPETNSSSLSEAVPAAADHFADVSWAAMVGLAGFFSPSGLSGFTDQVVSTPPSGEESAPPPALDEAPALPEGLEPLPAPDTTADDEGRVHSILGIITVGAQLDLMGVVYLVAILNIFLALFNLIPLLPFDGGHMAVATYERIREGLARRRLLAAPLQGGRYMADFTKLIPVTYAVVALVVAVGLGALYLDMVDPTTVPN